MVSLTFVTSREPRDLLVSRSPTQLDDFGNPQTGEVTQSLQSIFGIINATGCVIIHLHLTWDTVLPPPCLLRPIDRGYPERHAVKGGGIQLNVHGHFSQAARFHHRLLLTEKIQYHLVAPPGYRVMVTRASSTTAHAETSMVLPQPDRKPFVIFVEKTSSKCFIAVFWVNGFQDPTTGVQIDPGFLK